MQNIGGENAGDAFYRYKMPKLIAKIEGRGNGIKTNVVNNVDIAKALERPPEYILKFYGCELGAQTNFDKGTGTSIVNGAHDNKKLSELLEAFIKKYVQCYSCGNPETMMKIKKEFIYLKCKACGYVSDVDMRHKVNTFILKNPPENKLSKEERRLKKAEEDRMRDAHESAAREKEKKEKKEKSKDKDKKKDKKDKKKKKGEGEEAENGDAAEGAEGGSAEEEEAEESDDEVVWMTDTSAAAVAARAAEQLTQATAAMVTQGNIEAERAEAKKKAKAEAKKKAEEEAKKRAEEAAALRAALEAGEKLEPAGAESALRALLAEAGWDWAAGSGGPAAISKVAAGGLAKKLTVEGGVANKARALYAALFTAGRDAAAAAAAADAEAEDGSDSPRENGDAASNGNGVAAAAAAAGGAKLAPSIGVAAELLGQLAHDAPGQLAQLVALEWLLAVGNPAKMPEAALALYDADLAEEDIISCSSLPHCQFVVLSLCHFQVGNPAKMPEAALALKALYDADLAEEDIISCSSLPHSHLVICCHVIFQVGNPAKMPEAALALKALYDADLAEEDIILAWHGRSDAAKLLEVPAADAAAVRKAVAAVVDWLQEAESDDEDSEEESDEE
uniref:W2 domain-containing protein n=1 Tax=Tetradesmus obliquus TaxID=3088 RepID=A0A383W722_TETOB